MNLRKIKWLNHPILGNLTLDFINPSTGKPYNTILFAGENGTGKSTILESISSFLNYGPYEHFDYIEYEADDEIYKTSENNSNPYTKNFFNITDKNGNIINMDYDRSYSAERIGTVPNDLRNYGCVYSKARSDYKTQKITSTTISELDNNKHNIDIDEDFTSLKQLIIDVVNQDYSAYSEENKNRSSAGSAPLAWDNFFITSKLFRFQDAFDNFFDKMRYGKVDDLDGEKTILFSKNNKLIPVDKLSTGEKQIVFRGVFLLRNTKILDGATILIDEPELSMHPKWERKIFNYYKKLFSMSGKQNAQILFATHSDHVLREALIDITNNLVITLEEKNGVIACRHINAPSVLPSVTTAETTYLAFDVVSNDYHIELYGFIQDKYSVHTVKDCDNFIANHANYDPSKYSRPSGHKTTTYNTLSTYIRNCIHHPDSGNTFTEQELRTSIEFLISIC